MKALLTLVAVLVVILTRPQPLLPQGPDPDSDLPVQVDAKEVQHCTGTNIVYYKREAGKLTFHMELTAHCEGLSDKTYISKPCTVDVDKDPKGEAGAVVIVMMANEVAKAAHDDGFEITPKALLENTNLRADE